MSNLKMCILIKDDVPDKFVPVIAAHAALTTFMTFKDEEISIHWFMESFKKVICSVNQKEFDNMKNSQYKHVVLTESALEGREVCIGVIPTDELKPFKFYKMWKPKGE